jgi:hypothetical protein
MPGMSEENPFKSPATGPILSPAERPFFSPARVFWLALIASVGMVSLSILVTFAGCNWRQDYTIEFVVPEGYTGVIIVEEDRETGGEPQREDGNTYVYEVPETGILVVKNFDPFDHYHFFIARYAGGRWIPTLASGKKGRSALGINPNEIAFHVLGSQVKGRRNAQIIMCIGNQAEYQTLRVEYGFWSPGAKVLIP